MNRLAIGLRGVLLVSGMALFISARASKQREYIDFLKGDAITSIADAARLQPRSTAEAHRRATALINMVERGKEKLFSIPATERTFANTVRLYDQFKGLYRVGKEALDFHRMLSPDTEGRDAPYLRVKREKARLYVDRRIYQAFKEYEQYGLPGETLTREERYFFDKFMLRFKRMGLHLPEEKLEKVRHWQAKDAEMSSAFQSVINNDSSSITVQEDELAGVDRLFVDGCARNDDGALIIPANSVSYMAIMPHCHNAEVRRRFYFSYLNRGYPANKENLIAMAKARQELAQEVGFDNYAQMYCDGMMIREVPSTDQSSDKNIELFIQDLAEDGALKADAEFAERVKELPDGVSLVDGKLLPWDVAYVSSEYSKKFNFDSREVAKYFPVKQTAEGIFKVYEKFMNLEFELSENLPASVRGGFHESVQVMSVYTKGRQRLLGYIFMDLFPRPGKYSHACCGMTMPSSRFYDNESGRWIQTTGGNVLIANFPTPTEDNPGLLSHQSVTTFFHEFGHAIHALLGQSTFRKLAGYNVLHDFVELPSQILEEWMWDRECLKLVSGHYQTGEKLPDALIDTMFDLRKMKNGTFIMGQLNLTDYALRMAQTGEFDPDDVEKELAQKYLAQIVRAEGVHKYASFGHLSQYGPGYYGYLFSRAYAFDLLARIKEHGKELGVNGLLSGEVGNRFVADILRPGGSEHPKNMMARYLGRPANLDAFKHAMGLRQE